MYQESSPFGASPEYGAFNSIPLESSPYRKRTNTTGTLNESLSLLICSLAVVSSIREPEENIVYKMSCNSSESFLGSSVFETFLISTDIVGIDGNEKNDVFLGVTFLL